MIKNQGLYLPDLENLEVGEEILSSIDIEDMPIESLLFQTGYLTIKNVKRKGPKHVFTLTYPNLKVRIAFNDSFLAYILPDEVLTKTQNTEINLYTYLEEANLDKLKDIFSSFFASIPYNWYTKKGFYASLIYALFNGAGIVAIPEDTTNKDRIDLSVFIDNKIYIIEFKVVDTPSEDPSKQIKEKICYEKYLSEGKEIYLVGIESSKSDRNIVYFGWERIAP